MPIPTKTVQYTASAAGVAEDVADVNAAWKAFAARRRLGMLYKSVSRVPGLGLALGAIEGSAGSMDDVYTGKREKWMQKMGANQQNALQTMGWDTLRVLGDVGNALTFDLAGELGDRLSSIGR